MKHIISLLFIIAFPSLSFAQDAFTMKYACYKVFTPTGGQQKDGVNNGSWSKEAVTDVKVEFSAGDNKNIIIYTYGKKKVYSRTSEPFVSETPKGTKYQIINAESEGKAYIFQYMENYNLRKLFANDKRMLEYSCTKNFDADKGVNENKYSIASGRAYFYSTPSLSSKRAAYLVHGNIVFSEDDKNGFIYASFVNDKGKKTMGWLLKSNLSKY